MKNTVILKSYKDGIAIYLDDTLEFEQLCLDLAQKFRDSARFFGDMQVAVSFEGRTLTQEEENILVDTITSSSRLQVLCVIGKDAGLQNQFPTQRKRRGTLRKNLRAGMMDSFTAAA